MEDCSDAFIKTLKEFSQVVEKNITPGDKSQKSTLQAFELTILALENAKVVLCRVLMQLIVMRIAPHFDRLKDGDAKVWNDIDLLGLENNLKVIWLEMGQNRPGFRDSIVAYLGLLIEVSKTATNSPDKPLHVSITDDMCIQAERNCHGIDALAIMRAFTKGGSLTSMLKAGKKCKTQKKKHNKTKK